jgi:Nif-specific regulatory protein
MSGVSKHKKRAKRAERADGPKGNVLSELDDLDRKLRESKRSSGESDGLQERFRRLEKSYSVVENLLDVSAAITSTLDLKVLLENIVDQILKITGCQRGFVMLKRDDGSLSMEICRATGQSAWKEADLAVSRTIPRQVAATLQPIFSSNVMELGNVEVSESIHVLKIATVVCLPLAFEGELVGVIYADSKFVSEEFLDSDLKVMKAFAAQAAIAINNAKSHGELELQREHLEEQNISLRHKLGEEFASHGMITRNGRMEELFEKVNKIAPSDMNVLIQGETGTGKELLARAIHEKSSRRLRRFETVNCGAIPEGLVESILFGHRRGAFTGAVADRPGLFEIADGGTLFLDEIGDMPLDAQTKLLRAVEGGQIKRVGEEDKPRNVDVRVLSATNRDLAKAVKERRFRDDLYHRLKVAELVLPPLRDRREDIIPLAEYFLKKHAQEKKEPLPKLHKDAKEFLLRNQWEGNVRVLKSAIEYAIVFQDEGGVIRAAALKGFFHQEDEAVEDMTSESLKAKLQHYEAEVIRRTLDRHSWNITSAAKALAISRQQLHNKIKRLNITFKSE